MNEEHRIFCASDEWRAVLEDFILPWALTEVQLGPDVIEAIDVEANEFGWRAHARKP